MPSPLLEIDAISKIFYPAPTLRDLVRVRKRRIQPIHALSDVSFRLERGTIACILGANGAGKTTLLKIIATLLLPDAGSVLVDGLRLGQDDRAIKTRVGIMLDEERSFYWRLSGRQNLEFFASLHGFARRAAAKRITTLLRQFEVAYADRRFDSYSTGMKRQFTLMRCLLHDPQLILMDEPTKSLDVFAAERLSNFIRNTLVARRGKTILFTSHHLPEAEEFADSFLILKRGVCCGSGTAEILRRKAALPGAALADVFKALTGDQ